MLTVLLVACGGGSDGADSGALTLDDATEASLQQALAVSGTAAGAMVACGGSEDAPPPVAGPSPAPAPAMAPVAPPPAPAVDPPAPAPADSNS